MAAPLDGPFRVGPWIVDPASRKIRSESADPADPTDEAQRLGHKPLTVLQVLAQTPGVVVTKDELIERVWDGAATTDDAVMAVVYELRKALGDDARSPRYVETIRQRGYRLVADVEPVESTGERPRSVAPQGFERVSDDSWTARLERVSEGVSDDSEAQPRRRLRPIVSIAGLGFLLALALIAFDAVDRAQRGQVASRESAVEAKPGQDEAPQEKPTEDGLVDTIPTIRSLAIRPLAAFGDQCLEEPFVDSLTELLIAELVDGPPLEILGTGTGDGAPWPSEPTADAVIEGSILRTGDGLWVNVRLVESATGRLIWGASYERHGVDLLLERALASQIADDLDAMMGPAEAEGPRS